MRERIEYKTPDQVRVMRRAGLVVAEIHAALREAAAPGRTTAELDDVAREVLERAGARSNFLGYHGYPAHVCISVNEEVVHGIPGDRVLTDGDVVSFDCGAVVDGWHGDAAFTVVLGEGDPRDHALSQATRTAMWDAIAALAGADRLDVVGAAVEDAVAAHVAGGSEPLGIIEDYVGHGIGSAMHQPPDVLNYRASRRGPKLRPGMCLAIEPMLTRGGIETRVLADDWTVVTADGARAAHWEHSVAVTEHGIWVLTAEDGGATELERRNVRVATLQ
ncbi:type I methionyl aminopeptidase [Georgenia satyanarayanai]|uniref:type I methionyl aminopeptidase n=1 Tax=Georgenia satyanarayanai TaxID=860221 RepID=UPI001265307A|nr:type I methionyl aminopeptidase [Georgenia satyanarayanai]